MSETSTGLLRQARDHTNGDAWSRFVGLYSPLLHGWLRRCRLQSCDVDDLVQDVFQTTAQELPAFEHNRRPGAFRSWLKAVLTNRLRHFLRHRRTRSKVAADTGLLERLAGQLENGGSSTSQAWDREHDQYLIRRLLRAVEPDFEAATWRAFHRVAVDGIDPEAVAEELNLSVDSIYAAKSRVLKRLRQVGNPFLA